MRKDHVSFWQFGEYLLHQNFSEHECAVDYGARPTGSEVECKGEFDQFDIAAFNGVKSGLYPMVEQRAVLAVEEKVSTATIKRRRKVDDQSKKRRRDRSLPRAQAINLRAIRSRLIHKDASTEEDRQRYAVLAKQKKSDIARFSGWGEWATTDARRIAILKSQDRDAIAAIGDWRSWADSDSKRTQLLKTECSLAIKQVADWGEWADSDNKKLQILRSRCHYAIEQVKGWHAFINSDDRRIQLLRSKCHKLINQFDDWGSWVDNDEKRQVVLATGCRRVAQQVGGWDAWVNTDERRKLVIRGGGIKVMRQIGGWQAWLSSPGNLNYFNRYHGGCVDQLLRANTQALFKPAKPKGVMVGAGVEGAVTQVSMKLGASV